MSNRRSKLLKRCLIIVTTFLLVIPVSVFNTGLSIQSNDSSSVKAASNQTYMNNLRVEYQNNPIGVDIEKPRFSWEIASGVRGQQQTAYRILVATSSDNLTPESADVWDSGKVESNESVAVQYEGDTLQASTRYYWKVTVWDKDGDMIESSEDSFFETGLLSTDGVEGWDGAQWIALDATEENGAPMLRKEASLNGEVESARLYITALGVYDAYINGEKLGVLTEEGDTSYELLAPGWTSYDKEINYMTYDVTHYLEGKENVTIGAILGNGWYNSRISSGGAPYYSNSGNDLALFAKMLITYTDGLTESIVTDTTSGWKGTNDSPYISDDIYDGEIYDATKKINGWNETGFDDSEWDDVKEHGYTEQFPNAIVTSYNGKTAQIVDELDQYPISVTTYDSIVNQESSRNARGEIDIVPEKSESDPERAKEFSPSITEGETVIYDLGQNMVGVPNINVNGEEGTEIRIRFAEMLNDDSNGADGPEGSIYVANLRGAQASAYYTLNGDEEGESYQTSLSFYGFRYVEVTVLTEGASVEIENLTGKVATSAVDVTGSLVTSNQDVNQLISNIEWGQRGNYLWIPMDCPQRNERAGWLGDVQLFAKTGFYNMDTINFMEHFTDNMINAQYDNGSYPVTVPRSRYSRNTSPDSGWSDAGVIVPWTHWQMTGDTTLIERAYESMEEYMDLLYSMTGDTYRGPGSTYGDWLSFQRPDVSAMSGSNHYLLSDAFYAYDAMLMAEMAEVLGYSEDVEKYKTLFENIKVAFIENYIVIDEGNLTLLAGSRTTGNLSNPGEDNAQTSLLWALKLGLHENEEQRQQMVDLLVANIQNTDEYKAANPDSARVYFAENTLSVGFLGINVLGPVLSEVGHSDLAYTLLLQDEMPSWLYSVKSGATTIWERWNSYSVEDGFGPASMNSFNHFAYGAIGEWMYSDMLGISNDPSNPGFKHTILKPTVDTYNRIDWVKGSYDSVYGTIESEWTNQGNTVIYKTTVPANTTATLYLEAVSENMVLEGDVLASNAEGVEFIKFEDGRAVFELQSGSYEFHSVINGEEIKSIDLLKGLLESYIDSSDVTKPLSRQLTNSLNQVQHHLNRDAYKQAEHHLNNFLKHLNNKVELSESVKAHLLIGARSLEVFW
ncbi:family 78 glycoside hydrolase catalytic domain [Halalkalibacter sp. AB-rgal2]|uniref:alpha-L-rhamnosidase n=1 Tax=Halalkalibacter sp. AB-rgal2 TaxID=3242695 RepID=UPI00359CFEC6